MRILAALFAVSAEINSKPRASYTSVIHSC
jgi:hypothetical protein